MWIIFIIGMLGLGKLVVLNVFEDVGYYCVDNLFVQFIFELVCYLVDQGYMYLGVVIDICSCELLCKVFEMVIVLCKEYDVCMLFLIVSMNVLVQCYFEMCCWYLLLICNGCFDIVVNV